MGELADEAWQREAFGPYRIHMTTIENNVPVPPETTKPRKSRARKPKTPKESPAAGLLAALNFVALAQAKEGTPYQTHCRIEHGWLIAFNGTLSAGCPIPEDLRACPRTFDLIAALNKCGETMSITQLNENVLRIVSDKFKATIDCLPPEQVATSFPDSPIANIGDEIKAAFEALAWLATEGATRAFCASVALQANTAVATNGIVLCEYWHGYNLPPNLLIPKATVTALLKVDKKLAKFGFTADNSVTFWYEDGSYIKSQLFADQFPSYDAIFNRFEGIATVAIPSDFIAALDAVSPFAKSKFIYFKDGKLSSDKSEELGATYDLIGLPSGMLFNCELLKSIQPWFENVKFFGNTQLAFQKGMLRGAMMGGNPEA